MKNAVLALKERAEVARLTTVAAALLEPGARVDVVHVVDRGAHEAEAEAEVMVAAAVDELRAKGLRGRGHIRVAGESGVLGRLARQAERWHADIVVMGSRGLGHLGGLLGHSISHGLLARLELPVLIVPANARLPRHGFRKLLVAVRDELDVHQAVTAVELLRPGLDVLAVHAPRAVAVHAGAEPDESFVELVETSDVVLRTARRRLECLGIRTALKDLPWGGGLGAAIAQVAREWDADLLLLGSRRLRDWEALIAGSTSHDVIHLTDRPVLITPKTGTTGDCRGRPLSTARPVHQRCRTWISTP